MCVKIKVFKKGFNYSQDGQGNRLVYHLQGCNMSCPWCSNPEGWATGAVAAAVTPEEIRDECLSARPLMFDGGGVTFTGGEPTLQFEGLSKTLKMLKEAGINTAIETNSTHPSIDSLFPLIDEYITDFKHYDDEVHIKLTGLSNSVIKRNLENSFKAHKNVLVRTVLIKGINTKKEDAEKFSAFYSQYDTSNARFELLPYHEYGKIKWEKLGLPYRMSSPFIDSGTLKMFEDEYRKRGLSTVRT